MPINPRLKPFTGKQIAGPYLCGRHAIFIRYRFRELVTDVYSSYDTQLKLYTQRTKIRDLDPIYWSHGGAEISI